jgi:hypothetical protein
MVASTHSVMAGLSSGPFNQNIAPLRLAQHKDYLYFMYPHTMSNQGIKDDDIINRNLVSVRAPAAPRHALHALPCR